jgi:hypothetical protein
MPVHVETNITSIDPSLRMIMKYEVFNDLFLVARCPKHGSAAARFLESEFKSHSDIDICVF